MYSRPATASTAFRGSQEPAKRQSLPASAKAQKKNGYKVEGFAPTSRAAGQLREEGIEATTLQSFLARGQNHPSATTTSPHLYMLDESSLASTKQMRAFLDKIKPADRVLVIGDTAQHQGVDAGRPFEQMQDAGMRTSQLDQIVRQRKNPAAAGSRPASRQRRDSQGHRNARPAGPDHPDCRPERAHHGHSQGLRGQPGTDHHRVPRQPQPPAHQSGGAGRIAGERGGWERSKRRSPFWPTVPT